MKIAVIIPTLNEAAALPDTLASVGAGCDITIADGGSDDTSCAIAQQAGAQIVPCTPPRAQQLNAAARQSDADIFVFLHADTRLPKGWQSEIISILQTPNVVLGAFSLSIANSSVLEAFIARVANRRSRIRQLPYGDQGLFMYRHHFEVLGGFPTVPIMDDYIFVKTAQKLGCIVTSPLVVATSNRRWRKLGVWRTTWRNFCVVLGYRLGVPLATLQRYYRR
jgi:rSAM/selenodomain-associated transferase 2